MRNELFSIIIPTYNREKLIKRCIESVLLQSFTNFEVIIVDNNSQDKTVELVEAYQDPRIRVYKIDNHGVVAKSRNYGTVVARGEYLAFLDSDDIFFRDKLEIVEKYISEKTKIICHSSLLINSAGKKIRRTRPKTKELADLEKFLLQGPDFYTSSVVIEKETFEQLGGFDERQELVACEDFEFWVRALANNHKIFALKDLLGSNFLHQTNLSRSDLTDQLKIIHEEYEHVSKSRNYSSMVKLKLIHYSKNSWTTKLRLAYPIARTNIHATISFIVFFFGRKIQQLF